MLETLYLTVNEWVAGASVIAALGCFLWGMISVLFSPCHIASIPLIVAYVGGQQKILNPRQAVWYAIFFTAGLFITIALVGTICALMGRMLGDLGSYWQVPVGLVLVWVALGMVGVERCSISGNVLQRLKIRGLWGALVMGLAYGVLSGSCTFGFFVPIFAIITVQKKLLAGLLFAILFAVGHCLPIAVAGSASALVRKLLASGPWQEAGFWFRKGAGAFIGIMGIYFIVNPFFAA
jgi:cytochrome c-type biogenesis protein